MPTVLRPDPFSAVMLNSPPLVVSQEQKELVKKVLEKACSDSKFAEKAYVAISLILAGQTSRPPTVTSLTPNSAEIGDPSFTLHVHGTNFVSGSIIMFNGGEEPTTFVSPTEITTAVNMTTVTLPFTVPVAVLNPNGILSDSMSFTFTDGTPALASKAKGEKEEPKLKTPPKHEGD